MEQQCGKKDMQILRWYNGMLHFPAQGSMCPLNAIGPWGPPSPIKSNSHKLQIALIKLFPALQEGTVKVLLSMENFWISDIMYEMDNESQIKVALWSIVWSGRLVSGKQISVVAIHSRSPQTEN